MSSLSDGGNDLNWTGVVLRAVKSVRDLPVRPEIVQEARNACAELRLIGEARKRARRPTPGELEQLRDYFAHRDKHGLPERGQSPTAAGRAVAECTTWGPVARSTRGEVMRRRR